MDEALQNRTVLPRELEQEIWDYYRWTVPSLQEFYSRYTPEWEVFFEQETLPPVYFLAFLKQMKTAFRKRYTLSELDITYYIEKLENLPVDSSEQKQLQEFFLDKWHELLTRKEFDYQYQHIEALCSDFIILDASSGEKTEAALSGSRIRWLLLNHPQLYRIVQPYERLMERHPKIQELVRLLGKRYRGEKRRFDPQAGLRAEQLVHHAVQSDIQGVTLGDNLNSLLPTEYCYLADEALYPLFVQRYAEKRLQQFDCRSQEDTSVLSPKRNPSSGQGPYIVCIDTSGSMQGDRERLAKSALLAVARLTEETHRKCYVINFAEEIACMLIQNLRTDMPRLVDFLQQRFDGGTDILPAMTEALQLLRTNGWKQADVVMISDFEMPPASDDLLKEIQRAKRQGTSFYALVFGTRPEMDYLVCCDKYWEM